MISVVGENLVIFQISVNLLLRKSWKDKREQNNLDYSYVHFRWST